MSRVTHRTTERSGAMRLKSLVIWLLPIVLLGGACDDDDDRLDNRVHVVMEPGETLDVILEISVDESDVGDVVDCDFVSICDIDAANLSAVVTREGRSGEDECAAELEVTAAADAPLGDYEICVRFPYLFITPGGFIDDDDTNGYINVTVVRDVGVREGAG
jgi:hypothetical protein